jgi:hypothetical protein
MKRITHGMLTDACDRYNEKRGLACGDTGYLQWADIFGFGIYRPRLFVKGAPGYGLHHSALQGATMRKTLYNIENAGKAE